MVLDDSDKRPGAKFYEWELKGVPVRLELGPRDLNENKVVIAPRVWEDRGTKTCKRSVPIEDVEDEIRREFENIEKILYERAFSYLKDGLKHCSTLDDAREHVMKGVAVVGWCGNEECGHVLEDECSCDVLGEPIELFIDLEPHQRCVVCGRQTDRCVMLGRPY